MRTRRMFLKAHSWRASTPPLCRFPTLNAYQRQQMMKQTSVRVTGLTAFDAQSKFAPSEKQASDVKAASLVKFKDKTLKVWLAWNWHLRFLTNSPWKETRKGFCMLVFWTDCILLLLLLLLNYYNNFFASPAMPHVHHHCFSGLKSLYITSVVSLKVMLHVSWAFTDLSVLYTTGASQESVFLLHLWTSQW